MSDDRNVHAVNRDGDRELVRYDRAGKWYVEHKPRCSKCMADPRRQVSLNEAVNKAIAWFAEGGRIRTRVPGGNAFDAKVRKTLGTREGVR